MPKLTAMKAMRLSGRRQIQAGDTFEVRTTSEARALVALGRAQNYVEASAPQDAEREALRTRAEAAGVDDGRWGAARLQEEIAAAEAPSRSLPRRGRYLRSDMTAEDTD